MKIPQTKRYSAYKKLILQDERSKEFNFNIDGREYYIYRVTEIETNQHYYGSRIRKKETINEDFWSYCTSSKRKIIIKENKENYKVKIIKILDNSDDMYIYEAYLHQYFNVKEKDNNFFNNANQTPFGFNTCNKGKKHDTKTKVKMSKSAVKLWQDNEYKDFRMIGMSSNEYKEKISNIVRNRWSTEGYKDKMKISMAKAQSKPEYKEKLSDSLKKIWEDEEYKEKMSKSLKNKWSTEGYKDKMKISMAKVQRSPEYKEKMSKSLKKIWENEEYREKMVKTLLKTYILTDNNFEIIKKYNSRKELQKDFRQIPAANFLDKWELIHHKKIKDFDNCFIFRENTYIQFIETGEKLFIKKRFFSEEARKNMSLAKLSKKKV